MTATVSAPRGSNDPGNVVEAAEHRHAVDLQQPAAIGIHCQGGLTDADADHPVAGLRRATQIMQQLGHSVDVADGEDL